MARIYEEAIDHDAAAFLDKLWTRIFTRVDAMLGHHHLQHEPGGGDQVNLRLGELYDVYTAGIADGESIVYSASSKHYVPGTGGGGGTGMHQAHIGVLMPTAVAVFPGPTNISGSPYTVRSIRIQADGAVSGNFTTGLGGYSFAFGAGGGSNDFSNLNSQWTNGQQMSLTISTQGAINWLLVDIALQG